MRAIRERLEPAEASVRLARSAGVCIAAGSDFGGGSTRAGQLAWEVEALVRAGLEPWRALGAATWRGGQLLGIRDAGRNPRGRSRRLHARPRRPAERPCRALAHLALAWPIADFGVRGSVLRRPAALVGG